MNPLRKVHVSQGISLPQHVSQNNLKNKHSKYSVMIYIPVSLLCKVVVKAAVVDCRIRAVRSAAT